MPWNSARIFVVLWGRILPSLVIAWLHIFNLFNVTLALQGSCIHHEMTWESILPGFKLCARGWTSVVWTEHRALTLQAWFWCDGQREKQLFVWNQSRLLRRLAWMQRLFKMKMIFLFSSYVFLKMVYPITPTVFMVSDGSVHQTFWYVRLKKTSQHQWIETQFPAGVHHSQ